MPTVQEINNGAFDLAVDDDSEADGKFQNAFKWCIYKTGVCVESLIMRIADLSNDFRQKANKLRTQALI